MPAPVTVFVCTTCKRPLAGAEPFDRPGRDFAVALAAQFESDTAIAVTPVECLSVCKRPVTVALSGGGRFGYVVGDIDPALHLGDVASGARAYAATADGIVPWRQRPDIFRKGVIARIPPIGFIQPEKPA